MPLYFFDVTDKTGHHADEVGVECKDLEAARTHAREALPDLMKEARPEGRQSVVLVEIYDDHRRRKAVARLTLNVRP